MPILFSFPLGSEKEVFKDHPSNRALNLSPQGFARIMPCPLAYTFKPLSEHAP